MNGSSLQAINRDYGGAQDKMALLPNYYRWLAGHIQPFVHGHVIDLGCGAGYFIPFYQRAAESVLAVDVNPALLARLQASVREVPVKTLCLDLAGDWAAIADGAADCALAMDVLEHLPDDGAFVRKVRRTLKSGGTFIVKVPAQARLYSDVDAHSGHYRRYDAGALCSLMKSAGLAPRQVRPINALGALVYRFKRRKTTNFSRTFSDRQLRLANALIPWLTWLDRLPGGRGLSLIGVFQAV